MAKSYDEERVVTEYVWRHYPQLFTDFERKVAATIVAEAKTQHEPPDFAEYLRAQWRVEHDQAVAIALKDGVPTFQRRVCERILAEDAAQVSINRCPACHRVVRTPRAKQCRWCSQDWHVTT